MAQFGKTQIYAGAEPEFGQEPRCPLLPSWSENKNHLLNVYHSFKGQPF